MIKKYYIPAAVPWDSGGGGEGDKNAAPTAPKGYTPLSIQQRQDWNSFLDYLDKQGVAGKTTLDQRDQSLGLKYLAQYQKANPNTTVNAALIPSVQYEQYMLRKGDSFPTLNADQLKYIRQGLNPAYLARPVSPVDSWLGSVTSKLYYPTATGGTNTGEHYNYGVNFEDYAKSVADPSIRQKYIVK